MQSLQLLLQAFVLCELSQSLGCCAPGAERYRNGLQSSMQGAKQGAWLLHKAPQDVICMHRNDVGAVCFLNLQLCQYDAQCSTRLKQLPFGEIQTCTSGANCEAK